MATKLSVMDLTLGERGRLAVALRRAANVCDTGAGIFFFTRGMEEAGRGKRSDENSARGAPRGRGSPCETNTPAEKVVASSLLPLACL